MENDKSYEQKFRAHVLTLVTGDPDFAVEHLMEGGCELCNKYTPQQLLQFRATPGHSSGCYIALVDAEIGGVPVKVINFWLPAQARTSVAPSR